MASRRERPDPYRVQFKETPFASLMQVRVNEVLLVCSSYDRFILEEDGRIDEQVFQEYVSLGLRQPPRITTVPSVEQALEVIEEQPIDLVIVMLNIDEGQAFTARQRIKEEHRHMPVVILTRFSRELSLALERMRLTRRDLIFNWLGNANILLAIIKLIEDRLNVDHDVKKVGVYTIILVEDSTRYYSSYLPIIYRAVLEQARKLAGLNEQQKTLRMRGRPKILLATNFEEAVALYERYKSNLLGVISDISYPRGGKRDPQAGITLCRLIRAQDPELPILLQSSRPAHCKDAEKHNVAFLHKHSQYLLQDLRNYIGENFGFGDFVFRMPGTFAEVGRATSLVDLQHKLAVMPLESIEFHTRQNNFSTWLKARALFSLGNLVRERSTDEFESVEAVRDYLIDIIRNYRMHTGRGTIAKFDRDRFDQYSIFQRIGDGSLGGKARGIAFMSTCIKRSGLMFRHEGVAVQIPKTVVLTTSVFERFMDENDLYEVALSDLADDEILEAFQWGRMPDDVMDDLRSLVSVIRKPLAVRSSSLLEDSHYQPFAGVYSTYLIPNENPDREVRAQRLAMAVKGVYASTYYRNSKEYMRATQNAIDEEKMAVIVEEVAGTRDGTVYHPTFSGVARSLNYYPTNDERPEDGVVNVALGLGKWVVDGRVSMRFSPTQPQRLWQLSDTDLALRSTQKQFFAIDLEPTSFKVTTSDDDNLRLLDISDVADTPGSRLMMSTYDFQNHRIRDDPRAKGRKVVTFSPILRCDMFPLAEIVKELLEVGAREMNVPVEIEFAVNLDPEEGHPKDFKFLQIRPIVESLETEVVRLDEVSLNEVVVSARTALGNGVYADLRDLVYVKPDTFDRAHTADIAATVDRLNQRLVREERSYILIGPGRWGSTDTWLGVPVKWPNITNARVIVEASLDDFRVDASQGSHFFQNLTSFRVAYLTVNPSIGDGTYDVAYLDQQPALYEDDYVRLVRFADPLLVKVDGRRASPPVKAVIRKPQPTAEKTEEEAS